MAALRDKIKKQLETASTKETAAPAKRTALKPGAKEYLAACKRIARQIEKLRTTNSFAKKQKYTFDSIIKDIDSAYEDDDS